MASCFPGDDSSADSLHNKRYFLRLGKRETSEERTTRAFPRRACPALSFASCLPSLEKKWEMGKSLEMCQIS